jgi:WD40 repeat protein
VHPCAARQPPPWRSARALGSGAIDIIDTTSGAVRHHLSGNALGSSALSWHPDGRVRASAGHDGMVRRWLIRSGEQYDALPGGSGWAGQVGWSRFGSDLAASAGRRVRCRDTAGQLLQEWDDHASPVTSLHWHPVRDERAAACCGGVTRWAQTRVEALARHAWKGSVLTLAWSPDGRFIATGDQDSTMHCWILAEERPLQMWGYPSKVQQLARDASSRFLATGGAEVVTVWNCRPSPEGTRPQTLEGQEQLISALAFPASGPAPPERRPRRPRFRLASRRPERGARATERRQSDQRGGVASGRCRPRRRHRRWPRLPHHRPDAVMRGALLHPREDRCSRPSH